LGWQVESVNGQGYIERTADGLNGSYGVFLNNTGLSGSVFSKRNLGVLTPGKEYALSVWVKSAYPVVAHLQRMDTWSSGCRATHSGSGGWELLSCSMIPNDTVDWRLVIQANPGESLIWDNASVTQDGTPYTVAPIIPSSDNARQLLAFAHEHDLKVLYIASYMPPYLANASADCVSNQQHCAPNDPVAYANLVVQFINESTNNGEYADTLEIEVWNEPDLAQFWLPDANNTERYAQYNTMYAVVYDAVKAYYPQISVGGPAITTIQDPNRGGPFMEAFLAANANKMDFFSFHRYLDSGDYDATLQTELDLITSACASYQANCGRIVFDEFNVRSSDVKLNDPAEYAKQLGIAYAYLLDTMPENVTTAQYQWSETKPYRDGIGYPEYPQRWSMVSEPALDNALYASYNVTKEFATYHGAGSTVVNSASADPDIRIVASYKNEDKYVTIINGKATAAPVTLGLAGVNASSLLDVQTNVSYPVTDDVVDLGTLQPSQIMHLAVIATNQTFTNISFASTSSDASITEPANQTFSYLLSNPDSLNTTAAWFLNGAPVAGTTSYTFLGNYSSAGSYNVTVIVNSTQNTIGHQYNLLVAEGTPPSTPARSGGGGGGGGVFQPTANSTGKDANTLGKATAAPVDEIVNDTVIVAPASNDIEEQNSMQLVQTPVEQQAPAATSIASGTAYWIALMALFAVIAGLYLRKRAHRKRGDNGDYDGALQQA
jgi:hypothetical protein